MKTQNQNPSGYRSKSPAKWRGWILACIVLATLLLTMFPVQLRAGVDFKLSLTHGYDFFYPSASLNVTPAPDSYDRVESPSGILWKNSGTNNDSSPFYLTNNLGSLVSECTNGLWKLYLNKESPSETVYYFTVSVTGLTTNTFGDVHVLFPTDGSTGVTNRPTFHWTGPSNFPNLYLSSNDANYVNYFSDSPPSSTTNWTPSGNLLAGGNELYITYNDYNFVGITITTPTNALGQPLASWSAHGELGTYAFTSFQVTSSVGNASHLNVAHYDFEDNTVFTEDLSPAANDISSTASFGGGSTQITPDPASGSYAALFNNNNGSGAGWLTPPTNLLSTLAGSFSVSVWLKTTQVSGNDTDQGLFGNAGIISAFSGPSGNWVVPMALTGSKLAFATGGDSQDTLHSQASINTGQYVHLAVTRDQTTGEKKIYIDGQLDSQGSGSTDLLDGPESLDIGYNNGTGLNGQLDDIQIYSGVLSASEVEFLYNNPGSTVSDTSGESDFSAALESPTLTWTTGGNTSWFTQSSETHDGEDAAQSGAISDDEESWLETTVNGPGNLSFWWKVSSEGGSDYLEFYIDDNWQDDMSGDSGWQLQTYSIAPGSHSVRWRYSKDGSVASDLDAGFLDEVSFTPLQPPVITEQPLDQTNSPGYNVALLAGSTNNPAPAWQWFKVGSGSISGATNRLYVPANSGTAGVAGSYYAVASNMDGSAFTRTAQVTFVSAPLPPDWALAFKSPSTYNETPPEEYYLDCLLDSTGNLYTIGSFTGTNVIGANTYIGANGNSATLIVKQSATGAAIWSQSITNNGAGSSYSQNIQPAPGNGVYVVGNFYGTNWLGTNLLVDAAVGSIYLTRFDSNGTVIWVRTISGTNSIFTSYHQLVSDLDGNVTFSALFQGTVAIGATNVSGSGQYGVLAQFDASGTLRWVQKTSGWFQNLTRQATRIYGSMGGAETNYVGGVTNLSDRRWSLASLNATNGQADWLRGFGSHKDQGNPGGLSDDQPQVTVSGTNLFVVGTGWGSNAVFGPFTVSWASSNGQYFARYDTDGNPQLATSFGSATTFPGAALADASGNVYVAADFD
ncbi:MAG: LamG-like jellyroll fold domain-containing protein, partial [Verrucomicrobiota bacterium]